MTINYFEGRWQHDKREGFSSRTLDRSSSRTNTRPSSRTSTCLCSSWMCTRPASVTCTRRAPACSSSRMQHSASSTQVDHSVQNAEWGEHVPAICFPLSQEHGAKGNNDGQNATIDTATPNDNPRKAPQWRKHGNGANMAEKGFLMSPHRLAFISSAMQYCIRTNVVPE